MKTSAYFSMKMIEGDGLERKLEELSKDPRVAGKSSPKSPTRSIMLINGAYSIATSSPPISCWTARGTPT